MIYSLMQCKSITRGYQVCWDLLSSLNRSTTCRSITGVVVCTTIDILPFTLYKCFFLLQLSFCLLTRMYKAQYQINLYISWFHSFFKWWEGSGGQWPPSLLLWRAPQPTYWGPCPPLPLSISPPGTLFWNIMVDIGLWLAYALNYSPIALRVD